MLCEPGCGFSTISKFSAIACMAAYFGLLSAHPAVARGSAPDAAKARESVSGAATIVRRGNEIRTFGFGVPWEKEYRTSQAYSINGIIYVSGQFSHDKDGNFIGAGDAEAQTRQTFANLDTVLASLGLTKANIAYIEMYMTDPSRDFLPFSSAYKEYWADFSGPGPAVTLIGVTGLFHPDQIIEIRAIAYADKE